MKTLCRFPVMNSYLPSVALQISIYPCCGIFVRIELITFGNKFMVMNNEYRSALKTQETKTKHCHCK